MLLYVIEKEKSLINHKNDIITIYLSHIILHIALSWNIPWVIKSNTFTIFLCIFSVILQKIKI